MASNAQPPAGFSPPGDPDDDAPDPLPMPGQGLALHNADVVIDLFDRAAEANLTARWRKGATAHLPAQGRLIVTGDLHDNPLNFQRIIKLADLHRQPDHHLILHEVIHGPHRVNDADMSIRTLARVAALKLDYPDRVHLLQSNHELAQYLGDGILKEGTDVVAAFDRGIEFIYGDEAKPVRAAMRRFIRSLLLAVRCPSGIFCCHSLPSARHIDAFDPAVIDREPTEDDLTNSAHQMVWGRNHPQAVADRLAAAWNVRLFVMGHQPAEMGYEVRGSNMLILASDHSHGVALPIDLSASYSMDALVSNILPLGAITI